MPATTISRFACALAIAVSLCACAISPERIGRIDDRPVTTPDKAAMVARGSSKAFPNQIVTRWAYQVKLVDGKPFPKGKSFVQLEPGEHTLTLSCGARFSAQDTGWFDAEHVATITVEAGKLYWAWIDARQDGFKREYGSASTTAGRCWATTFNERNPFMDVSN